MVLIHVLCQRDPVVYICLLVLGILPRWTGVGLLLQRSIRRVQVGVC